MDSEEDYARLAQIVIDRRIDLGRTQMEVAHLGGLSLDRVSAIERGEARNLRAKTVRSLDHGLDWEVGSVRAVLAGGEPTPRVDRHVFDHDSARATETAAGEREPTLAEIMARMNQLAGELKELQRRDAERDEEMERLRGRQSG